MNETIIWKYYDEHYKRILENTKRRISNEELGLLMIELYYKSSDLFPTFYMLQNSIKDLDEILIKKNSDFLYNELLIYKEKSFQYHDFVYHFIFNIYGIEFNFSKYKTFKQQVIKLVDLMVHGEQIDASRNINAESSFLFSSLFSIIDKFVEENAYKYKKYLVEIFFYVFDYNNVVKRLFENYNYEIKRHSGILYEILEIINDCYDSSDFNTDKLNISISILEYFDEYRKKWQLGYQFQRLIDITKYNLFSMMKIDLDKYIEDNKLSRGLMIKLLKNRKEYLEQFDWKRFFVEQYEKIEKGFISNISDLIDTFNEDYTQEVFSSVEELFENLNLSKDIYRKITNGENLLSKYLSFVYNDIEGTIKIDSNNFINELIKAHEFFQDSLLYLLDYAHKHNDLDVIQDLENYLTMRLMTLESCTRDLLFNDCIYSYELFDDELYQQYLREKFIVNKINEQLLQIELDTTNQYSYSDFAFDDLSKVFLEKLLNISKSEYHKFWNLPFMSENDIVNSIECLNKISKDWYLHLIESEFLCGYFKKQVDSNVVKDLMDFSFILFPQLKGIEKLMVNMINYIRNNLDKNEAFIIKYVRNNIKKEVSLELEEWVINLTMYDYTMILKELFVSMGNRYITVENTVKEINEFRIERNKYIHQQTIPVLSELDRLINKIYFVVYILLNNLFMLESKLIN